MALVHAAEPVLPQWKSQDTEGEVGRLLKSTCGSGTKPLLYILLARPSRKIGLDLRDGKKDSTSQWEEMSSHMECHIAGGQDTERQAWGIITDNSENNLPCSHDSIRSLKSSCEGGVINPIFQMRTLRLGEFPWLILLFLPL